MEINLNSNGFGNVEFGPKGSDFDAAAKPLGTQAATASTTARANACKPSITAARRQSIETLRDSEPVANVPDSALSRDDALGKLVNSAFSLPPPVMPTFD